MTSELAIAFQLLAELMLYQNKPKRTGQLPSMEHRGKQFSVVQALEGGLWKWEASDLDGHTRSGTTPGRAAGIEAAKAAIDRALAPTKRRLVPPAGKQ
jgi:hypothetical protein